VCCRGGEHSSNGARCLPFDHLTTFYGQIGFRSIPKASVPRHLWERLEENLSKGEKMLVMLRPACLSRHENP
jgi:hypothetical protein